MKILRSLAIAAAVMHAAPAFARAPAKATASQAVQKEFEGFIAKFRAALKANDPAAVAAMTRLPFQGDASVRDAVQFRAKIYAHDFTAKNRACLQRAKPVYDRDGNNDETYHITCNELIFSFTRTSTGFLFTDLGVND